MDKITRFFTPLVLLIFISLSIVCSAEAGNSGGTSPTLRVYPYRWVYVSKTLARDSDVADIKAIAQAASESGLNGMVLAAGLDRLDNQRPEYFTRLEQVKQICKQNNIEIIPTIFSVGYGGAVLAENKNLAAGLLVEDALFVVENGAANFAPSSPGKVANGGF